MIFVLFKKQASYEESIKHLESLMTRLRPENENRLIRLLLKRLNFHMSHEKQTSANKLENLERQHDTEIACLAAANRKTLTKHRTKEEHPNENQENIKVQNNKETDNRVQVAEAKINELMAMVEQQRQEINKYKHELNQAQTKIELLEMEKENGANEIEYKKDNRPPIDDDSFQQFSDYFTTIKRALCKNLNLSEFVSKKQAASHLPIELTA